MGVFMRVVRELELLRETVKGEIRRKEVPQPQTITEIRAALALLKDLLQTGSDLDEEDKKAAVIVIYRMIGLVPPAEKPRSPAARKPADDEGHSPPPPRRRDRGWEI